MSRIINIIYKPHLAIYKAYEISDYTCCCVCDYKVFIETDNGHVVVASELDDGSLRGMCADQWLQDIEDNTAYFPFLNVVDENCVENWTNGLIGSGWKRKEAFNQVLKDIRESGCNTTKALKEFLEKKK